MSNILFNIVKAEVLNSELTWMCFRGDTGTYTIQRVCESMEIFDT